MRHLTISIDFDGVIAVDNYPEIGQLMHHAKDIINKWYDNHTIIINTCRSGVFLDACKDFLGDNGINYHFINKNDPKRIKQYNSDSRKISADVNFDDRNAGGFLGWDWAAKYITWYANRNPVIICIVGRSGSGKTTLSDYIERVFNVRMIQSRTTRPPRYDGEQGHTFVSDKEFDTYKHEDKIAFTRFGDHRYCCLHKDVQQENTYVIDERGLSYLHTHFSDRYDIYSILVTCNEQERIKRAGKDRVERDEGQFTMPTALFDHVWRTDAWREQSSRRNKEYEELHNFINRVLGRGWYQK